MQVEQKGVGKRIEAALHFRQTLSEKLPSARSKCIFCIFVIGHVFFGEMWSSFCQRSSQLVFASCMLVVCIFFGGVVSPFLLSLWFLWINWFRRKSDEMRHLLLPVLWLCFASHETVFWRPQLIKFCSSALLRLIWNGRLAGLVKNLENISISGAPKRLYKILNGMDDPLIVCKFTKCTIKMHIYYQSGWTARIFSQISEGLVTY